MAKKKTTVAGGLVVFNSWMIATVLLPILAILLAWVALTSLLAKQIALVDHFLRPDSVIIGFIAVTTTMFEFPVKVPEFHKSSRGLYSFLLLLALAFLSLLAYIFSVLHEGDNDAAYRAASVIAAAVFIIASAFVQYRLFK